MITLVRNSLEFCRNNSPGQASCTHWAKAADVAGRQTLHVWLWKPPANQGLQFEKLLLSLFLMPLLIVVCTEQVSSSWATKPSSAQGSLLPLSSSPLPPTCPHTETTDHGHGVSWQLGMWESSPWASSSLSRAQAREERPMHQGRALGGHSWWRENELSPVGFSLEATKARLPNWRRGRKLRKYSQKRRK